MVNPVLYTVGHSTHTLDAFVQLLRNHKITAVADVRSQPYSRRMPHFNRENLAPALEAHGIRYVFLGEELGARRQEPECYVEGQVDFRRVAELPGFHAGLARVRAGASRFRVALMCAEMEPLDCHRTILVCRALRREFTILHIRADGSTEDHVRTEQRLLERSGFDRTLFDDPSSEEQRIQRAYDERVRHIAYRRPTQDRPSP